MLFSVALGGSMQKGLSTRKFLCIYVKKNDSKNLILYLVAPVEALILMLVRNYFSYRTPNNSKRRDPKAFSKRCFPTYSVIAESPSIMSKKIADEITIHWWEAGFGGNCSWLHHS